MEKPVLLISDVHGDRDALIRLLEAARHFGASTILSAGDLCPDPYDPVFQGIEGVRGNCDRFSEYGDMPFPPLWMKRSIHGHDVFVTHGDRMWVDDFEMEKNAVFLSGHTHVPVLEERNGIYFVNPGSPSRPRSSSGPTFAVFFPLEIGLFSLLDFKEISSLRLSLS